MEFDFGTVSVVIALVLSIFNLWDKIESRYQRSKEPTKQLENRLVALEQLTSQNYVQKFAEYDSHFAKDLRRIEAIEEGNKIMQKAMLALLKHAIDGNNTDDLRKASKDLQDYLIDK